MQNKYVVLFCIGWLATLLLPAQTPDTAVATQVYDTTIQTILVDTTYLEPASKNTTALKTLTGIASFYAKKFEGRKTASGEIFSHKKFTAACNVLPLGTLIKVTNLSNGKSVIVKTNDRLHPKMKRIVDLTFAAAQKLDFIAKGLTRVSVEVLKPTTKKR
jgi:rare lipoprotein A